jgi:hypothetical protein
MKLLILLSLVLFVGAVFVFWAATRPVVEISARQSELPEQATSDSPDAVLGSAPAIIAPEVSVEEFPTPTPAPVNATQNACLALEARFEDDLDDAEQQLNRKRKAYDNAVDKYEQTLDTSSANDETRTFYKNERDAAKEEFEDAEGDYNGALKRLSKARQECGLFD